MKIDIRVFEDWYVLYLDGKKVYEDHDLEPDVMLDILDIPNTRRFVTGWNWDDLIPDRLEDLDAARQAS